MSRLLKLTGAQDQQRTPCEASIREPRLGARPEGLFGPEVQSHLWDLLLFSDCTYNVDMLPALVGTLYVLHESNMAQAGEQPQSTKVLLATKPRHASEEALFGILSDQGWTELHRQTLPLPVLVAEAQCVELYLYEKA
ncbi:hypothetical protein V8C42DRAFT_356768 [Trichoderma barbatum]